MKNLKTLTSLVVVIGLFTACTTQAPLSTQNTANTLKRDPLCQVNAEIERNSIPPTPNNMSLPSFGQGVIGWATGPEGAKARVDSVARADIQNFQDKGVTLAMVQEWQAFYDNEEKRNPCNPTAPYRAELMKKIAQLWGE